MQWLSEYLRLFRLVTLLNEYVLEFMFRKSLKLQNLGNFGQNGPDFHFKISETLKISYTILACYVNMKYS